MSVEPMSSVEMVIGDNHGNQIILLHATWATIMEYFSFEYRTINAVNIRGYTAGDL